MLKSLRMFGFSYLKYASIGVKISFAVAIIMAVVMIVAMCKIFSKANKPAWAALIPFYNTWVLCEMTWGHGIFMVLYFVPLIKYAAYIITMIKLGKVFAKETAYKVGLVLLPAVFAAIIAFDNNSVYRPISDSLDELTDYLVKVKAKRHGESNTETANANTQADQETVNQDN